jgi:transposase-like protein
VSEQELQGQAKHRLTVIRHAREVTGNVAQTCRYYGISRQTYYSWFRRHEEFRLDGLRDRSKRPHASTWATPNQEWEHFYNYARPHGSLGVQSPYERLRQKTALDVSHPRQSHRPTKQAPRNKRAGQGTFIGTRQAGKPCELRTQWWQLAWRITLHPHVIYVAVVDAATSVRRNALPRITTGRAARLPREVPQLRPMDESAESLLT